MSPDRDLPVSPAPGKSADHLATEPALRGFTETGSAEERRWEERFRGLIEAGNLRRCLKTFAAEPHHAGSPGSRRIAEWILGRFRDWGLDAWIEEFEALLPQPVERSLELLAPDRFTASLEEPPIHPDDARGRDDRIPTHAAYSADGDVTADLVYVNYGVPADYERLARQGLDVQGKIAIARYGGTLFRGLKPKTAAEHGAAGCIIYSDPRDDGYYDAPAYPDGPSRPSTGVQRGSTYYMPVQNGDPLAPRSSSGQGERLALEQAADVMPPIPVLPISFADALPLLRALGGAVAPPEWRGALPITYRLGPGPARVRLMIRQDWKSRPIYDVVARIEGAVSADQWVVRGNHHDAWVFGATDPGSGLVTLLETARALGVMLREGWRPRRTIVLACWDGEEWGLIGSSEWAGRHASELERNAVAYLNTDLTGRDRLIAGGSPSLRALVAEAARDVRQPGGKISVLDAASPLELYGLGAETDYAPFIGRLGIASLDLWFDGGWHWRGAYHSAYDTFDWYARFGDPTFEYVKALTETTGTILLRLAGAAVLPFSFGDLADAVAGYVVEIERLRRDLWTDEALDWSPVEGGLARLRRAGGAWDAALERLSRGAVDAGRHDLDRIDRLVYSTERLLCHDPGLPNRPWFRHLIYAADPFQGRLVSTLPMIREGIERGRWDQAREFMTITGDALERVANRVEEAAAALEAAR
jgi:N-acetylated-alpha-linked acidic dipeptidase